MTRKQTSPSVLIVENDIPLLETLVEVLSAYGFTIAGCASDAATAKGLVLRRPDMALVDYHLKDGPCDSLLRTLDEEGIPFAVFSGYDREDLPVQHHGYLQLRKPFDVKALLDLVERVSESV